MAETDCENTINSLEISQSVLELKLDVRLPRAIELTCERLDGKEDKKRLVVNRKGKVRLQ